MASLIPDSNGTHPHDPKPTVALYRLSERERDSLHGQRDLTLRTADKLLPYFGQRAREEMSSRPRRTLRPWGR
jgi:hypothetical protein